MPRNKKVKSVLAAHYRMGDKQVNAVYDHLLQMSGVLPVRHDIKYERAGVPSQVKEYRGNCLPSGFATAH